MPRLIRTAARTAVIAGTATSVSGRVQRRQAERFAAPAPVAPAPVPMAPAPAPAAPAPAQPPVVVASPPPAEAPAPAEFGTDDMLRQLERLASLRDQGVLTEEEFAAQKAKILGR